MPLIQSETNLQRVYLGAARSAALSEVHPKSAINRERALQVVLVVVGLIFLVGLYSLMMFLWPRGWRWQPHQPQYEQMIQGVYATLGVFLLIAARRPAECCVGRRDR